MRALPPTPSHARPAAPDAPRRPPPRSAHRSTRRAQLPGTGPPPRRPRRSGERSYGPPPPARQPSAESCGWAAGSAVVERAQVSQQVRAAPGVVGVEQVGVAGADDGAGVARQHLAGVDVGGAAGAGVQRGQELGRRDVDVFEAPEAPFGGGGQVGLDDGEVGQPGQGAPAAPGRPLLDLATAALRRHQPAFRTARAT